MLLTNFIFDHAHLSQGAASNFLLQVLKVVIPEMLEHKALHDKLVQHDSPKFVVKDFEIQ